MQWIEIIHIRFCSSLAIERVRDAFHELKASKKPECLLDIQLFRSLLVDSDLAVFLCWSNEAPWSGNSPLGLRLASAFSDFGRINHVSWTLDNGLSN